MVDNRVRRTTSDDDDDEAERRRRRASKSVQTLSADRGSRDAGDEWCYTRAAPSCWRSTDHIEYECDISITVKTHTIQSR